MCDASYDGDKRHKGPVKQEGKTSKRDSSPSRSEEQSLSKKQPPRVHESLCKAFAIQAGLDSHEYALAKDKGIKFTFAERMHECLDSLRKQEAQKQVGGKSQNTHHKSNTASKKK